MKIARRDIPVRNVDDALDIVAPFAGTNFKFDIAIGTLHGDHPPHINRVSDRIYFILNGSFQVTVNNETYSAEAQDTFVIPAGAPHGINGNGEFLIITGPPFAPENEELVQ